MQIITKQGKKYTGKIVSIDSTGQIVSLEGGHMARLLNASSSEDFSLERLVKVLQLATSWGDCKGIAIPVEQVISPLKGFVFEVSGENVPLSSIIDQKNSSLHEFMNNTGDSNRRLSLLINAATILNHLHMSGLCASIVSPECFLISNNTDSDDIFFASTEWVRHKCSSLHRHYAEGYANMKLLEGFVPNSWVSDMYAFGIMTYELLTMKRCDNIPSREEIIANPFIPDNLNQLLVDTLINDKAYQADEWIDRLNASVNSLSLCSNCNLYVPFNDLRCPICRKEQTYPCTLSLRHWGRTLVFENQELQEDFAASKKVYYSASLDYETGFSIPAFWLTEDNSDDFILKTSIKQYDDMPFLLIEPLQNTRLFITLNKGETIETENEVLFRLHGGESYIVSTKPLSEEQNIIIIDNQLCLS